MGRAQARPYNLALLAHRLLLRRYRAAPRTLAGACVGVRALAAHRQIPPVADPAIRLNFDQPPDIHLDLLAEIAFHAAFLLDSLAKMIHFFFGQVADLLGVIHPGLRRQLLGAFLPDAVDGRQSHPQPLLNRKINTCYACHKNVSPGNLASEPIPGAACASGWCKSRAPPRAGESLCTCRKSFLPMLVLS